MNSASLLDEHLNLGRLSHAGEGVWSWDIEKSEVTLSAVCSELLGLAPVQNVFTSDQAQQLLHPSDREQYHLELIRCFKSGNDVFRTEVRIGPGQDEQRNFVVRGVLERDEKGIARRMFGSVTDVTHRRKLEQALNLTASAVSGTYGEDFFETLLNFLCQALNGSMAFVGSLNESKDSVSTVAV